MLKTELLYQRSSEKVWRLRPALARSLSKAGSTRESFLALGLQLKEAAKKSQEKYF
jgi:hypothetical protein